MLMTDLSPVSYTHLDVYKRQTVTCVVTGHLLKDPNTAIDACTKPKQVDADIDTLRKILMNK